MTSKWDTILAFMEKGGAAIWVIAALAALTAGLIVWKVLRLAIGGAWRVSGAERAVQAWCANEPERASEIAQQLRGTVGAPVRAAILLQTDATLPTAQQREETLRVAAKELDDTRRGLRGLELVATIAPLVGLLGTVLGMVSAFQALEAAGNRADPSALAGGIWEALLTTAAGMAVAIPASGALTWFESVSDRAQGQIEDMITRIFVGPKAMVLSHAKPRKSGELDGESVPNHAVLTPAQ
ncbi:MAG: MotA/TolQ/ExbB proton channel family protein [Maritimibacter sp.]